MARNIITIRTNDSLRRLEVAYDDDATYYLKARQKRYYVVAKWVAKHQQSTGKPIEKDDIIASVEWYNKERVKHQLSDRQAKNIAICTSFSTFYSWWMEDFLDPAKEDKGCWVITDTNGSVEDQKAREVLSDVFRSDRSHADGNTYWLGDIARVQIIVGGEDGERISIGPTVVSSSPDLTSHTRCLPDTQKTRGQSVEDSEAVSTDLQEYLQLMEEELSRNRLLEQFGRKLEDLRIPLRVVRYEPVHDLAEIRDREHFRRTGLPEDASGRGAEVLRRSRRAYAFRGTVQEDRERSSLRPENLAELEPKLRAAILLGDPGSGKTEWLKYLARQAARIGA